MHGIGIDAGDAAARVRHVPAGRSHRRALARRARHRPVAGEAHRRAARRHGDRAQRGAGTGQRVRGAHPGDRRRCRTPRAGAGAAPPTPRRRGARSWWSTTTRTPPNRSRRCCRSTVTTRAWRMTARGAVEAGRAVPARRRVSRHRHADARRSRNGEADPAAAVGQGDGAGGIDRLGTERRSPAIEGRRLQPSPGQARRSGGGREAVARRS